LVPLKYRTLSIIIAVTTVFFVISSNIIISFQETLAKPGKDNPGKGHGKNKEDKERDGEKGPRREPREEKKEEPEKIKQEPKEAFPNFDYSFGDVGDTKRENFNFVAAGDFGCSQNAKNTISNMRDKKPELVLPLGDLSTDKTATCWLDLVSPFDDKMQITFGYHDVKDGKSKTNQYIKTFDLDELYYSFDYRHVHFITMSTLSDFNVTSDQYKFIEEDLKKASENGDIDWIVVTSYGPFYTSPSKHPAKNDVRNIYHPLFDRYGVDLVLNGHNHNYQRTYPVIFNPDKASNPTVTNTFTTGYNGSKDGIVYAIVGTAGEGFHPLADRHPYVATQFEGKFGFLNVEISNGNPHTNLTGTFYDNKGSNVTDYFTIEKEINSKQAE
jgi:hypothetical protein